MPSVLSLPTCSWGTMRRSFTEAKPTYVQLDTLRRLPPAEQPEDASAAGCLACRLGACSAGSPSGRPTTWDAIPTVVRRLRQRRLPLPIRSRGLCLSGMGGEAALQRAPERLTATALNEMDHAHGDESPPVLQGDVAAGAPGGERRVLGDTGTEAFARYRADRPQMLVDWAAGRDTDGAGEARDPDLRWQPALYRRARAALGGPGPVSGSTSCAATSRSARRHQLPSCVPWLGRRG